MDQLSYPHRPAEDRWAAFSGNPDFVLSLARDLCVIEAFQRITDALAMNSGVHAARVTKQHMLAEFLPVLRRQATLLGSMLA